MTDKRQAIIDAIQAIQEARAMMGGQGPITLPPGEINIDVDPDLLDPKRGGATELSRQDVNINDPDNVLGQKKDKKNQQKGQGQGQGQSGSSQSPDNPENQGGGETGENPQNGQEGKEGGDQGGKGNQGQKGKEKGGKDSPEDEGPESGQGGDEGPESGETGSGEDDGPEGLGDISDDYADAWNEIMDRFDDDSVSEAQLKQLLDKVRKGSLDTL